MRREITRGEREYGMIVRREITRGDREYGMIVRRDNVRGGKYFRSSKSKPLPSHENLLDDWALDDAATSLFSPLPLTIPNFLPSLVCSCRALYQVLPEITRSRRDRIFAFFNLNLGIRDPMSSSTVLLYGK